MTLSHLRDTARPLLIFAPQRDDPQMQRQMRILTENATAVAERDITVIALPYTSPSRSAATMTAAEASATRRRFRIQPTDFVVILVGKDGGEKLRSRDPIPFATLRETIDAMPMRQDEMRRRGQQPGSGRH